MLGVCDGMRTILFDLDGTLLPMSMEKFTKDYFTQLALHFANIVDSKTLIHQVLEATEVMVRNTEKRSNEEVFIEHLRKLIPADINVYMEGFDNFYDTSFLKLKDSITPNPLIPKCIELLKDKGYALAIATNPLFPLKAILHRIDWSGLDYRDFMYISCFEKNCYCKPNVQFFTEVLSEIDEQPENCLMVGNDVEEDLVSKKVGLRTYLIDNNIIHRGGKIITDYRGSYDDFYRFVKQMPKVNDNE
jgi:FMN phosphatase YigB (HAD superfamily)